MSRIPGKVAVVTGASAGIGEAIAPRTTTEICDDMKAHGQRGWDEYVVPLQPNDIARAVRYVYSSGDAY